MTPIETSWGTALERYYATSTQRADFLSLVALLREQRSADSHSQSLKDVQKSIGEVTEAVARQTLAVGTMTQELLGALARNSALLTGILNALTNPLETAAKERLNRGVQALKSEWIDDAIEEFDEALKANKYLASAHLFQGLAYDQLGNPTAAGECYRRAIKYGRIEPSVAAGAILLLCGHVSSGVVSAPEAAQVVMQALPTVANCPEVLLRAYQLTGSTQQLRDALNLDPTLAIAAAIAELPELTRAAEELLNDPTSSVAAAKRGLLSARQVYATLSQSERVRIEQLESRDHEGVAETFLAMADLVQRTPELFTWFHRAEHALTADTPTQLHNRSPTVTALVNAKEYLIESNKAFLMNLNSLCREAQPRMDRGFGRFPTGWEFKSHDIMAWIQIDDTHARLVVWTCHDARSGHLAWKGAFDSPAMSPPTQLIGTPCRLRFGGVADPTPGDLMFVYGDPGWKISWSGARSRFPDVFRLGGRTPGPDWELTQMARDMLRAYSEYLQREIPAQVRRDIGILDRLIASEDVVWEQNKKTAQAELDIRQRATAQMRELRSALDQMQSIRRQRLAVFTT